MELEIRGFNENPVCTELFEDPMDPDTMVCTQNGQRITTFDKSDLTKVRDY